MLNRLLNTLKIPVILILILISGCYELPDKIILPEWDTDLNLPIANRRFTVDDLIREQGFLSTDGLSVEDSIYILESEAFNLDSDISNFIRLTGFAALSDIPVYTDSQNVILYLQFPNGAELDSAGFLSGTLEFSVDNPTDEEVNLQLLIPGICDQTGNSLLIEIITPPKNVNSVINDLKGYQYSVPEDQPPEYHNSLMVNTSASTSKGDGEIIFLDFSTSDFRFSYVSGIMPVTSLGTRHSSFSFASGLDDYRDKSVLREAEMHLNARLITMVEDPYPVNVENLNIIGLRNDGMQFLLKDSTGSEDMFIHIENGSVEKVFNENNSNITEFISFLPDTVMLRAEYIMNPENQRGSATIDDSVSFETTFKMKSFVALKKSTVVDSSEVELTQDQKDAIRDGNSATVIIELENAIPITGWFKIDMVDEYHNTLFTISQNSDGTDTLIFEGAKVDGNGEVIGSTITPPVTVELNSSQIEMLTQAKYAVYSVTLRTSDAFYDPPKIIAIRPGAWVNVRAYGNINYRMRPEDL